MRISPASEQPAATSDGDELSLRLFLCWPRSAGFVPEQKVRLERLEHTMQRVEVGRVATAFETRDRAITRLHAVREFLLGDPEDRPTMDDELGDVRPAASPFPLHFVGTAARGAVGYALSDGLSDGTAHAEYLIRTGKPRSRHLAAGCCPASRGWGRVAACGSGWHSRVGVHACMEVLHPFLRQSDVWIRELLRGLVERV